MQQSDRPYQDASETVSPVKTAESNLKLPVIMKSVSTQKVETNEMGTTVKDKKLEVLNKMRE